MPTSWRKIVVNVAKILAVAACFSLLQHEILVIRSDVDGASGQVAVALDRYKGEVALTRDELVGVVESSHRRLLDIQQGLEKWAEFLQNHRDNLTRLIATRSREFHSSIDSEMTRYKDEVERIVDETRDYEDRIRSVEEKLGRVVGKDPGWMERNILFPIAQLKGEGTVGSGVLVYSGVPARKARDTRSRDGRDGETSPLEYTSFVITACHVVMEILGPSFPEGSVDDLQILDPGSPRRMTSYTATVTLHDESRDLALLRLDTTKRLDPVARALPEKRLGGLRLFTGVYAVGCPLGNDPIPTYGEISSRDKMVGGQQFWMINAPTFFGNSGGGVFLASTGDLIGISSMIYTYGKTRPVVVPHMGLFVPIDAVASWLDSEGYRFVLRRTTEP